MALVEDLLIRINGQDVGASAALRKVGQTAEQSLGGTSGLAKYGGLAKAAMAGLAVGGVAVVTGELMSMIRRTAETGDKLNDMSARTGITVRALGGLALGARQTGTSLETVEGALNRLINNAQAAKDPLSEQGKVFARLGISVTDVNGQLRPAKDLLSQVAEKIRTTTNPTERLAIAQDLLGKSGGALIPMLTGGAAGMAELQAKAESLGVALSASAADDIAKYNDATDDLETAWEGVGTTVALVAIPMLTRLTNDALLPALRVIKDIVGQNAGDQNAPVTRFNSRVATLADNMTRLDTNTKNAKDALAPMPGIVFSAGAASQTSSGQVGGLATNTERLTDFLEGLPEVASTAKTALDGQTGLKKGVENLRPQIQFASDDLDHFDDMLGWVAGTGQDGRGGLEGVDSGLKDIIDTSESFDDIWVGIAPPSTKDWVEGIGYLDTGLGDLDETARKLNLPGIAPPPSTREWVDDTGYLDTGLRHLDETARKLNLPGIASPPSTREWVEDIGSLNTAISDLDETAGKLDLSDIAPPPSAFKSFAENLGKSLLEPAGKQSIESSLISTLSDLASGGSFKNAVGSLAVTIATSMFGPQGGAVAAGIMQMIGAIGSTSTFAHKKYAGITGEVVESFKQGGIGTLLSSALSDQQRQYQRGGRSGESAAIRDLAEEIRKELPGLNVGEAQDMAQALLTNNYYGARGQGLNTIIRRELVRQQVEDLQRSKVMSSIGAEAQGILAGDVPAWSDLSSSLPPPPESSLPPPPPPPAADEGLARAASELSAMKSSRQFSQLALRSLYTDRDVGWIRMATAINQVGLADVGIILKGIARGEVHSPGRQNEILALRQHTPPYTIVAQRGMWRVPGGEDEAYPALVHGQERILTAAQTRAMDAGLGEFQGSAGPNIYITNHITANDSRDMDDYVTRRLGPSIQRFIQAQGRRGVKMVESRSILTRPTV